MKLLVMLFLLFCGAVLQAVAPAPQALGGPRIPLLGSLVIYYALYHNRTWALWAGVLAGLLHDALGMLPLGYSAFCYVLAASAVQRVRTGVYTGSWTTHAVLGALTHGGMTLLLWFLLARMRQQPVAPWIGVLRVVSNAALGALTAPLVCRFTGWLEGRLGLLEGTPAL